MTALSSRSAAVLATLAFAQAACPLDEFRFRSDMYDFDQRRTGLPGGGNMYCVPTSFTNICAYFRAHGMPNMMGNTDPNNHTQTTNFILLMGTLMGTNAQTGTQGSYEAEWAWVDVRTANLVFFGAMGPSSTWGYRTIMNQFRAGAMVRIGYGRYLGSGNVWARYSGHSVTIAGHGRFDSGSAQDYFLVTDPGQDDGDPNQQSPITYLLKETSNITLNTTGSGLVTHARYTNWSGSNNDRRAMVDNMTTFLPVYAGWTLPNMDNTEFSLRFQYMPGDVRDFPLDYRFSVTGGVDDWCFDPMEFGVCYLGSDGRVVKRDIATGAETLVTTSGAISQVAIGGPDQDVYVLRDGAVFDTVIRFPRRGGSAVSRTLPGRAAAIEVDEVTGGLVALDADLRAATAFNADFTASRREPMLTLALSKPTNRIAAGGAFFSIDSDTGDYLVAVQRDQGWMRYRKSGAARVGSWVPATVSGGVQRLMAGPQATVFVQDGTGRLQTFSRTGVNLRTEFSGLLAGGPFKIPKSFRALRPGEMLGSAWYDVPPQGNEP
jgi:hypothetical protein